MTQLLTTVFLLVFILGGLSAILALLKKQSGKPNAFVKHAAVLSAAEITFHRSLTVAVPDFAIFTKVRVADVLKPKERDITVFNRAAQKHFDWLICHPVTFAPLIAIELDDSSHSRSAKTMKSDKFKDEAAKSAGLPLQRFRWQSNYQPLEIAQRLAQHLPRNEAEQERRAEEIARRRFGG